jgi:hypothetical protein
MPPRFCRLLPRRGKGSGQRQGAGQPTVERLAQLTEALKNRRVVEEIPGEARELLFRVTERQRDARDRAIAVSGARGSLAEPLRIRVLGCHEFPLADACIWRSHVTAFTPQSLPIFDKLFDLLSQSPGDWLALGVRVVG